MPYCAPYYRETPFCQCIKKPNRWTECAVPPKGLLYLNLAKAELSSLMAALVTAWPTAWLICCLMCGGSWFTAPTAAPAADPGRLVYVFFKIQLKCSGNKGFIVFVNKFCLLIGRIRGLHLCSQWRDLPWTNERTNNEFSFVKKLYLMTGRISCLYFWRQLGARACLRLRWIHIVFYTIDCEFILLYLVTIVRSQINKYFQ